jgi:glycosyltransferase involved in cell wall biosynthesis
VSDVALGNFNKFFPNLKADIMEYGIPDFFLEKKPLDNNKIVFATVGYIYAGKGQDILLKAIKALDKDVLNKCEFWIIGAPENQAYMASLLEQMKGYPVVHIEKVAHDEMIQLYKKIDVVVCPSRQDSLPIVMTEAFMNYKIAIMSDVVGTTKYVENEKQAFIFKSGDDKELSSIIRQVVLNFEKLDDLRDAGRRVYDDVFSMSAFEKRISSQIVSLE